MFFIAVNVVTPILYYMIQKSKDLSTSYFNGQTQKNLFLMSSLLLWS